MSEEIATAAADLDTVRQLRAALAVALAENDQHQAVNAALIRELVYARAVVAAARHLASGVESTGWTRIYQALDEYDRVRGGGAATPLAPELPSATPPA